MICCQDPAVGINFQDGCADDSSANNESQGQDRQFMDSTYTTPVAEEMAWGFAAVSTHDNGGSLPYPETSSFGDDGVPIIPQIWGMSTSGRSSDNTNSVASDKKVAWSDWDEDSPLGVNLHI